METGGPAASGRNRPGRGVDIAVWAVVILIMIGAAAVVAWYLSNASFSLREVTYRDDTADFEMAVPVAPAPDPAPPVASTAGAGTGERIELPRWVRQPAPLFPELAASRGVRNGDVTLLCEALASGELGACQILIESPPDAGFGEAALDATRDARVTPRSIDGFRTDGTIRFTIRFQLVD